VRLRDQLTSGARTILLVLMAAAVLVFVITVSNVANLILARTVRRENELSIRAALGATTLDLRRVLLAESLLLCAAGAAIGILIAQPMVALLAQYASRFSVRALDLTVDSSMLWVGAGLAMIAAALLAFRSASAVVARPRILAGRGELANHRRYQSEAEGFRTGSDRRVLPARRRVRRHGEYAGLAGSGTRSFRDLPCSRSERAGDAGRKNAQSDRGLLPGGGAANP
jgi:hypothetical protein